jgi:hypothetical protein
VSLQASTLTSSYVVSRHAWQTAFEYEALEVGIGCCVGGDREGDGLGVPPVDCPSVWGAGREKTEWW